ncbi:MAG: DUF2950 family protein [Planctomycetota bacterium]|nr:DUF2950 family protein [Planctomycetota bacterium]
MSKIGVNTQGARLQYNVRELIFVTALTFFGMCLFLPMLRALFEHAPRWWRPVEIKWTMLLGLTLFISVATASGCVLGRALARRMRVDALPRLGLMFAGALCGWSAFGLCAGAFQPRSRMAPSEIAGVAYCRTYQEAQDIYRRTDWDGDGVLEYAQHISGANSLYELTPNSGNLSLVDANLALAECGDRRTWFRVKVLYGQGPNVPGGRRSYLKPKSDGRAADQTGGYALVLWPAKYTNDNAPSFLIDAHGVVYFKDLGPDTAQIVANITEYNPDETWEVAP